MIDKLKPYAEYKESEVPWIGKIPQHWRILPNRALLKLKKKSVGVTSGDYTLLSLTKQGIIPRDLENPSGKFPANFETYQIVEPGDLIFCLFDIDETPRAVGLSNLQGMITGAYTRFACNDPSYTQFVYLFFLAMDNGKLLKPLYSGLRKVITKSTFLSAKTPFPPPEEQAAIVRFLNYANWKIDRFIRTKRRLIELLNEQKQAIIHRAVTRGLDPNAKLKPFGIDWLGDVPEDWEVKRSKYVFREVDARSTNGEETKLSMSQKLGLVRSSLIEERRLMSESFVGAKICEPGDLVLNRLKAHLGVFALASEHGLVSPDYTVFRAIRPICGKYFELAYRTPACRVELRKRAKGIVQGFWRLYSDDFYQITVPIPPLYEQNRIIAQLETDLAALNHTITDAHREIDLLREYRTRLISDVVTGKLDVSSVELPAMDEAETPDDISADEEIEAEELIESEEVADADE